MEKPNYYSIIPANIRYDKELIANAKLLYGEITALCNEKGICWAGNEYFADLYAVSKETISRWINQLKRKGYINTKIFYKKDSKEIDKRVISIVNLNSNYPIDENVNTYCQKSQSNTLLTKTSIPYPQKNQEGIDENIKENITSINNKEKEERNLEEELKNVIDYYENNITIITPFVAQDIQKYLEDGLKEDLIIETIKEAVSRNARNWKYISSILKNCCDNNITTAQQFKIKQEEFKTNKNQGNKKEKTNDKEQIEYDEVKFENEEEYRKKLFEEQKG